MFINRRTDKKKKKREKKIDQLWFNHILGLYRVVRKNELKALCMDMDNHNIVPKNPKLSYGEKNTLDHYIRFYEQ